jgi:glutathione reductase (NADPH)
VYDLIVLGGGSGGLACAKRAASYNATVAVIEGGRYGGTCVNVGCVPKKVMFNTSHVMETVRHAKDFGISVDNPQFHWDMIKKYRDRYIQRLNGIYESGLDKLKIDRINGFGVFLDKNRIQVGDKVFAANHILIAVGGKPVPVTYPGNELTIDSNGFFELTKQPKKVAVVGAGYIAVELAGVFQGLGTETSLFCRHDNVLRYLDPILTTHLKKEMDKFGKHIIFSHFLPSFFIFYFSVNTKRSAVSSSFQY